MRRVRAGVALLLALCGPALAHPLAPALLQLHESAPGQYEVLWRTSVTRAQGIDVAPQLPQRCREASPRASGLESNTAVVTRWRVDCGDSDLSGSLVAIAGLERSAINVILRIEPLRGATIQQLLHARQTRFVVPEPASAPPVFGSYWRLGVRHLLTGLDHVLFVAGLVLLVGRFRRLLLTLTAFTLGHSLTLSLATLGLIRVNAALMELGIAISILVLALELMRPREGPASPFSRHPGLMAAGFGLLHGMGFAGALADVGLPPDQIPLALLAFNLGIEAGQILLVPALLACAGLWRSLPWRALRHGSSGWRVPATYVTGALAAFWCFERTAVLLG